jgi:hypothetical protein
MTYDVVWSRKQVSAASKFRVYGRPIPKIGELISLPVGGRAIRAPVDRIIWAPSAVVKNARTVDSVNVTGV